MYLLDTNVLSELRKAGDGRADRQVVECLSDMDANRLFISAMTVMELELGVLRVERRDATQGALLRSWMDGQVIPSFRSRILPVDDGVAQRCARLHVPDPRPERDAFIAATALVHGMIVVTRDVADFEKMGVRLINPWDGTAG